MRKFEHTRSLGLRLVVSVIAGAILSSLILFLIMLMMHGDLTLRTEIFWFIRQPWRERALLKGALVIGYGMMCLICYALIFVPYHKLTLWF